MEQIIRIPYKYWELINTMEDCQCWELMKALFSKNPSKLKWLTLTYYNIIIVDINNIENQVIIWRNSWKKWGRPKKNNPPLNNSITPPFRNSKPNISKDKINKDKIKEINININSKELTTEVETFWNEDINNMQEFIKKEVENYWYIYKPWKQERNRIKNILTAKQINEIAEKHKMSIYDFVWNIFKLSNKIDFWNWKINNAETFYKHYDKIYNDWLSLKIKLETKTQNNNIIYTNEI